MPISPKCASSVELNVATVWDDDQIERWAKLTGVCHPVTTIFGCLQQQVSGHGRSPSDVPFIEPARLVAHVRHARKFGLDFLYLLNGRCEHLDLRNPETREKLLGHFRWIVEDVGADCIVVADLRIARLIRAVYGPDVVRLRVSTVAAVMSTEDLLPWLPLSIDGVVLHHDLGRDFESLVHFVGFLRENTDGVEVELLLNESCLAGCHTRDAHYARLAREGLAYAEGFQQNCNIPRFREPSLLLSARWIRPEDMARYRQLGIRRFKIAGREMPGAWLDRAVAAYTQGRYTGNLVNLLTMTPPGLGAGAETIVFIDNLALEGFLDELRVWQGNESSFYRSLAHRLWEGGAFRINDPGSTYELRAGGPHCIQPGRHLRRLAELQAQSDQAFGGGRLVRLGR